MSLFDYPGFFPNKLAKPQGKNGPKWRLPIGTATQQHGANRESKKDDQKNKDANEYEEPIWPNS